MAKVTYDDRSFLIDGRRIWLASGSIHYFRTPRDLWRDRLLKARRGGLNCISTYMPWNVHEQFEGKWASSGDFDVAAFVRLAGELGLYVILRPGPYIGADWDFGGLPAWLSAKSGVTLRGSNAAYTHYYDKYFGQMLGRLADLQVSRNGNIVLIQNENEYRMTTMPDRLNYLEFVNQLFRRSGFDIPIINCNLFSDPPVGGNVECVNGWDNPVRDLTRMRARQPNAPLVMTELRCSSPDAWGREHKTCDDREVARKALEAIGCGAQVNYRMFHGGTNFAFWGSQLACPAGRYATTSYDCDAPLAEGGGLTEKYYLTRLVNVFAQSMGSLLAGMKMGSPGVNVHDGTSVLNLSGPRGQLAVVTNNGQQAITQAHISLPQGVELDVSLEMFGATAVPVDLVLPNGCTLDYSNLMPLGFFGENSLVLVLHGPAGWAGRVSIAGRQIEVEVGDGEEVAIIECEGMTLVVINSDLATRTWEVDKTLVFGPAFVGESIEDVLPAPQSKQYSLLPLEAPAKLVRKKAKAAGTVKAAPRLGTWRRIHVCNEPRDAGLDWRKMDRPTDVDRLGIHYGYAWYRMVFQEPRARNRKLFLPNCEDRASMFLNGQFVGVWGRGQGATREPLEVSLKRGTNTLTLLVDNLGRASGGNNLGGAKGLFGPVYDAKVLRAAKPKLKPYTAFTKRIVPRQLHHVLAELENTPVWSADLNVKLTAVAPIHLSFANLPHTVAIICNERVVKLFVLQERGEINFGDVTLGSELRKGQNQIRLLLWGDVAPKALDCFKMFFCTDNLSSSAQLSSLAWAHPQEPYNNKPGKDLPAWHVNRFKYTPDDRPLFLRISGPGKGQIFLNGKNLGRFWSIGPQEYYYLPAGWLEATNELKIFQERGASPTKCSLHFRPLGPYR